MKLLIKVCLLVGMHLRFHGYSSGQWTDAAVRRYVRDAGDQLTRLHKLTRRTAQPNRRRRLPSAPPIRQRQKIGSLCSPKRRSLRSIRPDLDGETRSWIARNRSGTRCGDAYVPARTSLGSRPVEPDEAKAELLQWWDDRNSYEMKIRRSSAAAIAVAASVVVSGLCHRNARLQPSAIHLVIRQADQDTAGLSSRMAPGRLLRRGRCAAIRSEPVGHEWRFNDECDFRWISWAPTPVFGDLAPVVSPVNLCKIGQGTGFGLLLHAQPRPDLIWRSGQRPGRHRSCQRWESDHQREQHH